MLFHSLAFFYFFIVVYAVYLTSNAISKRPQASLRPFKLNKLFLLGASYYFYGYWDYRFLALMLFSTAVNFFAGQKISRTEDPARRKSCFVLTLAINFSLLGFFKYCNFFIDSANYLLASLNGTIPRLDIVLPIGISFYTFHSLSYIIDIYFRRFEPTPSFFDFALFVAFFPQLVAGPIVRASQLLPQFKQPPILSTENFFNGLQMFLYGLFLKVVVADNIAPIIDPIFKNPGSYDSLAVWAAVLGYSAQIFCDFCGYSEMAIGTALCFGYILPINFRAPYLATDLFDFWRRWHISLTSWLRDYLYIPLGGNQYGLARTCLNVIIVMFLGGLWHGAKWNFVLWGIYHGFGMLVNRLLMVVLAERGSPSSLFKFIKWLTTFLFVCFGWVLFRAEDLRLAGHIYEKLLFLNSASVNLGFLTPQNLFFLPCLILVHLVNLSSEENLWFKRKFQSYVVFVLTMVFLICLFAPVDHDQGFIYFQF